MEITEFDDKCIIVRIPIGSKQRENLYEATRRCWRGNINKAKKADYVLGTIEGKIICVIKVENCNFVSTEFCESEKNICKNEFGVNIELCKKNKRIVFEGKEEKNNKYFGKILPEKYIPGQMPIRYTY